MRYFSFRLRVAVAAMLLPFLSFAQLRLPAVISSGMVLQQRDSVLLWGWSNPGEKVYVTCGWDNRLDSTTSSSGARWQLKVATPAAGGPYDITFRADDTIRVTDVLIGEVWVCSGQSNMELSLRSGAKDIEEELATAANPMIRFFKVPKTTSTTPQDDVKAAWTACDSNTLKSFTAVGYFFGKQLQQSLHVPIGLIMSAWGGTPAEAWTPEDKVTGDATLREAAAKLEPTNWWPTQPALAYNAMIAPLTHYDIAGAIWYQGESNTRTNSTYSQLLGTMIDSWRSDWQKQFPFYYVQIAPFNYGDNLNGALLQEAQTKTMSHPHVGMVVTTDLIDSVTNIHPSKKRPVGVRLANWALAENYHQSGIAYRSPSFANMEKKGNTLILSFDNVPTGLMAKDKKIVGFSVADEAGQWRPADATIRKDKIIVSSKAVKAPAQVRYAFSNTAVGNVFSTEGLPLIPFRTDK